MYYSTAEGYWVKGLSLRGTGEEQAVLRRELGKNVNTEYTYIYT